MGLQRFDVLGVWVEATDPSRVMTAVRAWIRSRERRYLCFANVHAVMESHKDPTLRAVYNAGITVPDGMPLVWLARARGFRHVARVYGPDFMVSLCAEAAQEGWPCYFYGGASGIAERVEAELMRRFPGLRSVGVHAPPFRPATEQEAEEDVARINEARPDVVFVALGCPKQERWMAAHRTKLEAPILAGVGAAFDFVSGNVAQAPRSMRRAGLEWLFRLIQEPGRLWYRYLVFNPLFAGHLVLEALRRRRRGPDDPPPEG